MSGSASTSTKASSWPGNESSVVGRNLRGQTRRRNRWRVGKARTASRVTRPPGGIGRGLTSAEHPQAFRCDLSSGPCRPDTMAPPPKDGNSDRSAVVPHQRPAAAPVEQSAREPFHGRCARQVQHGLTPERRRPRRRGGGGGGAGLLADAPEQRGAAAAAADAVPAVLLLLLPFARRERRVNQPRLAPARWSERGEECQRAAPLTERAQPVTGLRDAEEVVRLSSRAWRAATRLQMQPDDPAVARCGTTKTATSRPCCAHSVNDTSDGGVVVALWRTCIIMVTVAKTQ